MEGQLLGRWFCAVMNVIMSAMEIERTAAEGQLLERWLMASAGKSRRKSFQWQRGGTAAGGPCVPDKEWQVSIGRRIPLSERSADAPCRIWPAGSSSPCPLVPLPVPPLVSPPLMTPWFLFCSVLCLLVPLDRAGPTHGTVKQVPE